MNSRTSIVVGLVLAFAGNLFAQEIVHTKDSLATIKENVGAKKAVLVDVREIDEWEAGHLTGAIHLAMSDLADDAKLKELTKKLDKNKIVYTYCKSGGRSAIAGGWLKKQGFDVRPLKAGYKELTGQGFPGEVVKTRF